MILEHLYPVSTAGCATSCALRAGGLIPGRRHQRRHLHSWGDRKHDAFGIGLGTLQCSNGQTGNFFYSKKGKGGGRIVDAGQLLCSVDGWSPCRSRLKSTACLATGYAFRKSIDSMFEPGRFYSSILLFLTRPIVSQSVV
jgi:hypothetical protein